MRDYWSEDETAALAQLPTLEAALGAFPHRTPGSVRLKWTRLRGGSGHPSPHPPTTREGILPGGDPGLGEPPAGDADWETWWHHIKAANRAIGGMAASEGVTIGHDFPDDRPVGVAFLGDTHIGGAGVDYDRLEADLATIAATDGLYVVGMGDYIDNFQPNSKAALGVYEAAFPKPEVQLRIATMLFERCRGKWLALLSGNHDGWTFKGAGITTLPQLATHLETDYAGENGATLRLTVGWQRYVIVAKHQFRGQSQINKSNSNRRLWDEWPWSWDNADVVVTAHYHEPDTHITRKKGEKVALIRTGSYKVRDGYAENGGFKPSYGLPVVIFDPDRRSILPFDGEDFEAAVEVLKAKRARHANLVQTTGRE